MHVFSGSLSVCQAQRLVLSPRFERLEHTTRCFIQGKPQKKGSCTILCTVGRNLCASVVLAGKLVYWPVFRLAGTTTVTRASATPALLHPNVYLIAESAISQAGLALFINLG